MSAFSAADLSEFTGRHIGPSESDVDRHARGRWVTTHSTR